jgi:DNA primase
MKMNTNNFINNYLSTNNTLQKVIARSCELLKSESGKDAFTYIKSRVSDKIIKNYKFGYFPNSNNISQLNVDIEDLKSVKLIFQKNLKDNFNTIVTNSFFENHSLIFPIQDEYNNIVGLIGRTLLSEKEYKSKGLDKYKYTFFSKSHILFGLNKAKESIANYKSVILVEGQLDCIQLQSHGIYNSVALGGLDLHYYQYYLLKKYGGEKLRIYALLDNDERGQEGIRKLQNKFKDKTNIIKLSLPSNVKDIDDHIKSNNNLNFLANI